MTATVPRIRLVHVGHSSDFSVRVGGYRSLDETDAMLARALVGLRPTARQPYDTLTVQVVWDDGYRVDEHLSVGPEHRAAAEAADVGLLRFLLTNSAKTAVAGSRGLDLAPFVVEQRRHRGRELLRRLIADGAGPRNAASATPRILRVHITVSDNDAVRIGRYDALAHVDAMLAQAFDEVPAPEGRPYHMLVFSIIWSDGFELSDRVYVSAQLVRDAEADGGILRHALLRMGRARASAATYRGWHPDLIARYTAEGRAFLARIEADATDDDARRNAAWRAPSLLPDPAAAIGRLRDRFASRREILRAVGEWDDEEAAAYPATNHADVRYVINFVALALRTDVATLSPIAGAVIWNHWSNVKDTVETLLRAGADTDVYEDNEGLWVRQLPALVRLLDDARDESGPLRNGRLTFRPVGGRGDAYPSWLADLRGRSGVYVIRVPGESGDLEVVYVGSSSADRLHETLTRHFQTWRRWKGFWRGQYSEGHDPGLTYDRDTAEAAVIVTPPHHAYEMEMRLIRRLRPRDNLIGQAADEEVVPF